MVFFETYTGARDELIDRSPKAYDRLVGAECPDESITGFDEDGVARIVMDAEKCAVVYMVIDHDWKSPAMRWTMIEAAYKEIRKRLRDKGYVAAYCFFPDGVSNGYVRRLVAMGAERVIDRCIRFSAGEG